MLNYKNKLLKEINLADDYYFQGKYDKALNTYNNLVEFLDNKEKIDIYYRIADIYSILDLYEKAFEIYKKIINISYEESGGWYGLGYISELLGKDVNESLFYYNNAIKYNPNYKEAYYYSGTIYGDLEDYDKAEEYFIKALEIDPEDFIIENDLGSIYEKKGNYSLAKKHIDKSISINSTYYMSHFNLAVVYEKMGYDEKAIDSYNTARSLSDNEYIYLNMSALYIRNNRLEEALDILSQGIEKNKNHLLYYNRACVYSKLRAYSKSRKDIEKAKKLSDKVSIWMKDDPDLQFLKENQ